MGTHIIRPGETLSGIAVRFRTTVAELMRLNPQIRDPNIIRAGATIRVPTPPTPPAHQILPIIPPVIPIIGPVAPIVAPIVDTVTELRRRKEEELARLKAELARRKEEKRIRELEKATITRPVVPTPPVGHISHTLRHGETLWDLAVRHLGSGTQWTRIIIERFGRPVNEAEALTLRAGDVVFIPQLGVPTPPAPTPPPRRLPGPTLPPWMPDHTRRPPAAPTPPADPIPPVTPAPFQIANLIPLAIIFGGIYLATKKGK